MVDSILKVYLDEKKLKSYLKSRVSSPVFSTTLEQIPGDNKYFGKIVKAIFNNDFKDIQGDVIKMINDPASNRILECILKVNLLLTIINNFRNVQINILIEYLNKYLLV